MLISIMALHIIDLSSSFSKYDPKFVRLVEYKGDHSI